MNERTADAHMASTQDAPDCLFPIFNPGRNCTRCSELHVENAELRRSNGALQKIALDQCKQNMSLMKTVTDVSKAYRDTLCSNDQKLDAASHALSNLTEIEEILCKAGVVKKGSVVDMVKTLISDCPRGIKRKRRCGNREALAPSPLGSSSDELVISAHEQRLSSIQRSMFSGIGT